MINEVEGDNLSMECMVMFEDETEGVCDVLFMELVRVVLYVLFLKVFYT